MKHEPTSTSTKLTKTKCSCREQTRWVRHKHHFTM